MRVRVIVVVMIVPRRVVVGMAGVVGAGLATLVVILLPPRSLGPALLGPELLALLVLTHALLVAFADVRADAPHPCSRRASRLLAPLYDGTGRGHSANTEGERGSFHGDPQTKDGPPEE